MNEDYIIGKSLHSNDYCKNLYVTNSEIYGKDLCFTHTNMDN